MKLIDFGARLYDPFTARWTAKDPMAAKYIALGPYNYCAGSPANLVDPDGKKIVVRTDRNGKLIEYKWRQENGVWGFYDENSELYSGSDDYIKSVSSALLVLMVGENGRFVGPPIVDRKGRSYYFNTHGSTDYGKVKPKNRFVY